MSPWRSAAITLLATIAGASVGAAASLALSAGSLGFATVSVPRCTNAGLTVTPVLTASTVTSVTVSTFPPACGGATMAVTVDNGTTTGTGSVVIPGGGGSVSVPITGTAALLASARVDFVILGP